MGEGEGSRSESSLLLMAAILLGWLKYSKIASLGMHLTS